MYSTRSSLQSAATLTADAVHTLAICQARNKDRQQTSAVAAQPRSRAEACRNQMCEALAKRMAEFQPHLRHPLARSNQTYWRHPSHKRLKPPARLTHVLVAQPKCYRSIWSATITEHSARYISSLRNDIAPQIQSLASAVGKVGRHRIHHRHGQPSLRATRRQLKFRRHNRKRKLFGMVANCANG